LGNDDLGNGETIMAKRNRKKKNDATEWLAGVQKRPSAFDQWRQLSWRLPLQPKHKKPMSAYADRNLGIFIILVAVITFIIVVALAVSGRIDVNISNLCLILPVFIFVEVGLIKVGLDHIRYSSE